MPAASSIRRRDAHDGTGIPVAGTPTQWYGGQVYNTSRKKENGFLPDLGSVPADIRKRAKVLVINYPNNPTGARRTNRFKKTWSSSR